MHAGTLDSMNASGGVPEIVRKTGIRTELEAPKRACAAPSRSAFRKMTGVQDIYVKRVIRVFWATPMGTSGTGVDLIEVSLDRNIVGT